METIKKLWVSYKQIVIRNCTDSSVHAVTMEYWQNRIFSATIIYMFPLILIPFIPGFYMAYITGLKGLMIVDIIALVSILVIAFLPGITVFVRKIILNTLLYVTAVTLLLYLGTLGPGLLYMLAATIFIVLTLDIKYGWMAVGSNTLICIGVGFILHADIGSFYILDEYGLGSWIAVSSNLIILSATTAFLLPILFNGLRAALEQEQDLRIDLEREKSTIKKTLQKLEAKNDELERFAYTVSHDLKEPLRMVRSFMELLDKKYSPELDEKAKSYIYYAVDGSRRMAKSIDDLLEYSRIGRLYSDKKKIDINEIVDEVLHLYSAEIEKSKTRIDTDNLPVLKVVPVTIKMLFQNLISNALKYRNENEQPVIEITHQVVDGYSQFSVRDNGIGIEKEHYKDIFEIFRRLHTREKYQGNGMGLAICKKIVEQHQGKIWVESEPGRGSTFYFTIKK